MLPLSAVILIIELCEPNKTLRNNINLIVSKYDNVESVYYNECMVFEVYVYIKKL